MLSHYIMAILKAGSIWANINNFYFFLPFDVFLPIYKKGAVFKYIYYI